MQKTGRRDKPIVRVENAMRRLSRDRWLSPATVRKVAVAFARLAGSSRPSVTAEAAVAFSAYYAGMLRGRPASWPGSPGWGVIVDFGRRYDEGKVRTNLPELRLLQIIVQHSGGQAQ